MHRATLVPILVLFVVAGFLRIGSAQQTGPLTIRSVTKDVSGTLLTITGQGFGSHPVVTIDGDQVAVLSGGSDSRLTIMAPATLSTTTGTYRLTVVDTVQQVSDVFVVVAGTGTGTVAPGAGAAVGPSAAVGIVQSSNQAPAESTPGVFANAGGGTGLGLIEDNGSPYRTAIGYQALFSNQANGIFNTAAGYGASFSNTTGSENTSLGTFTNYYNTTGNYNTATGYQALTFTTTGSFNTATGGYAANSNTTGVNNAAFGYQSLYSSSGGANNTAAGYRSMFTNSSGYTNVAVGWESLYSNTTGATNTATGGEALYKNTTGSENTGIGLITLYSNTTGSFNVALGSQAGFFPTTGNFNLFLGAEVWGTAADSNTTRIGVPYDGTKTPAVGQNRTFISGIRGVAVSGAVPVVIDANGQLGTAGGTALSIQDASNTQPYQLRLGSVSGLYDYGIGRNPADGVLDFTATQPTYSGYRFNVPGLGTILAVTGAGHVGIGLAAPTQPLHMASGAYVSAGGVWTNASSRTLKERIAPVSATTAAETLRQLAPVTFVYKASPSESHVGFIAEDVPDLVASQDRRGLAAMDVVAIVTKVVQEQQRRLTEQQKLIDELRARLTRLESRTQSNRKP